MAGDRRETKSSHGQILDWNQGFHWCDNQQTRIEAKMSKSKDKTDFPCSVWSSIFLYPINLIRRRGDEEGKGQEIVTNPAECQ